jgi:hypothetical protein
VRNVNSLREFNQGGSRWEPLITRTLNLWGYTVASVKGPSFNGKSIAQKILLFWIRMPGVNCLNDFADIAIVLVLVLCAPEFESTRTYYAVRVRFALWTRTRELDLIQVPLTEELSPLPKYIRNTRINICPVWIISRTRVSSFIKESSLWEHCNLAIVSNDWVTSDFKLVPVAFPGSIFSSYFRCSERLVFPQWRQSGAIIWV